MWSGVCVARNSSSAQGFLLHWLQAGSAGKMAKHSTWHPIQNALSRAAIANDIDSYLGSPHPFFYLENYWMEICCRYLAGSFVNMKSVVWRFCSESKGP